MPEAIVIAMVVFVLFFVVVVGFVDVVDVGVCCRRGFRCSCCFCCSCVCGRDRCLTHVSVCVSGRDRCCGLVLVVVGVAVGVNFCRGFCLVEIVVVGLMGGPWDWKT